MNLKKVEEVNTTHVHKCWDLILVVLTHVVKGYFIGTWHLALELYDTPSTSEKCWVVWVNMSRESIYELMVCMAIFKIKQNKTMSIFDGMEDTASKKV